jgi:hypothetical protein
VAEHASAGPSSGASSGASSDASSDELPADSPWLPLPDVADLIGLDVGKVRRLVQERVLIAVRRGPRNVLCVHRDLIRDGEPMHELRGTLVVLADAGFSDEEAVEWLFTEDPSLPGTPVDALRAGRKTEIRRRAQALGF